MSNQVASDLKANAPAAASSDALADELDSTVMMLGRIFSARHGEMCAGSGLNTPQMLAMRVLAELGPSKTGDLAALLGVKAPAASALIDSLEKRGYVEREIDADDRRVHIVSMTETGGLELAAAESERREHMKRYLSVLDEDDVRLLIRVHRTLIEAMTANRI